MELKNNKFQKYWLHSVILLSPIYFRSSGVEGISFVDIFSAVFFFGTLVFWLFWTIFVQKKNIFRNKIDFFLIFFFVLALGNVALSMLNGVQFLDIMREYVVIFLILYYFPFRENFDNEKDLKLLLYNLSFTVLIDDFGQFYDYYVGISQGIQYAYQIVTAVRINQTIFTFTIITGIMFILFPQKIISRLWIIIVVSMTSVALITTFSRAFWVLVLFSIVFLLFFLPFKQKILLSITTLSAAIIIMFVITTYFQDKAQIVFKVIENRLESSEQGKKDISLRVRLVEYNALFHKIKENPLQGNGFFKPFVFYNIIEQVEARTITVHNGYLYIIYRLGIPMALIFFSFYFYFAIKSVLVIYKTKPEEMFYKFIAIAGFIGLFILLAADMTSSQFIYRDGTIVFALSSAFIEISYKKIKSINVSDNTENINVLSN
jgi:hypothetical protein